MWLPSCICVLISPKWRIVYWKILVRTFPTVHSKLKIPFLYPYVGGSTSAPVGGAWWKDRRPSGPSLTLTASIYFPGTHTCAPPPLQNTLDILNAEDAYLYGIDKE